MYKPNNSVSHVEKVSRDAKNMDACKEENMYICRSKQGEAIKDQSRYGNQYVFLNIVIFFSHLFKSHAMKGVEMLSNVIN